MVTWAGEREEGSGTGGENRLDYGYILNIEPIGFSDGWLCCM